MAEFLPFHLTFTSCHLLSLLSPLFFSFFLFCKIPKPQSQWKLYQNFGRISTVRFFFPKSGHIIFSFFTQFLHSNSSWICSRNSMASSKIGRNNFKERSKHWPKVWQLIQNLHHLTHNSDHSMQNMGTLTQNVTKMHGMWTMDWINSRKGLFA